MPRLYAGIDGGGTKTLAVVVDEAGRERGRAVARGSNLAVVGVEAAAGEIATALRQAVEQAGATLPITAVWLGLAGVEHAGTRDLMFPHLHAMAGEVRLGNDAELVLTALPGATGVAVIGGTGSICLGRDPSGKSYRTGGWGHIIGDEGSGYELGQRALQAASRVADGRGPQTALLDAIVKHWNLETPWQMIERVYLHGDKASIAALSSLVFDAARQGDAVARRFVSDAAGELAIAAVAVADNLDFGGESFALALAGGLLTHEATFRQMVARRIRRRRAVGHVAVVTDVALSAARAAKGMGRP